MGRAIVLLSSSAAGPFGAIGHALARFWRELMRSPGSSYRPERHYMRGPGPAWRAKHGPH